MKRRLITATGSIALAIALVAGPAAAAPGDNGKGVGGCISGNFYGNTTNDRPSGHGVIPSQSPGPWVNNPSDPDNPTEGSSVGDITQLVHAAIGPPAGEYTGRDVAELMCTFP